MQINKLTLRGFRNYREQTLTFDPTCNVIHGENAQGKTNLLEAVVYLSCGRSPRTRADRELIGFESPQAFLRGEIFSREREFITEITLQAGRRRKMTVNGVAAKNASELSDVLHTVFFSPEDLFIIREGAAARRKFMDQSLCQLRPRYAETLGEYHRLYEHKTRILRDSEENPSLLQMLPEFNEQMCRMGAILIHYRAQYCRSLQSFAAPAHADCSGGRESLALRYETVKTVADPFASVEEIVKALRAHQESHYRAELASGLCLSGPHKDDFLVEINGRSARQFCSQGQVRTAALAARYNVSIRFSAAVSLISSVVLAAVVFFAAVDAGFFAVDAAGFLAVEVTNPAASSSDFCVTPVALAMAFSSACVSSLSPRSALLSCTGIISVSFRSHSHSG